MWKYAVRRFLYMLFTVWVISIITFVVIQLPPGDFVTNLMSQMLQAGGSEATPHLEEAMRAQYGLDQPVYVQYFKWLRNVFKGDFGYSFTYLKDAKEIIGQRLPMTFTLSFSSLILVIVLSLPIGIYSAVHRYSLADYLATFFAFVGLAIPSFLLALVCLFLSYKYGGQALIGLFSAEFADAPWSLAKVVDLLKHLWIPVLIIGLGSSVGGVGGTAIQIRVMRANLLDELKKPYVDTARAKGLPEGRLLWKYPVRHALIPFVSNIGWALPALISGEAIVAIVLNLPTSGPVLLDALTDQDMYVAAGFILLLSMLTVIGVFISDLLLAWVDPRIRLGQM
jgi:peptide/nickel transport system permease protein